MRRPQARGQALAEFALVFPIFMLLLFGVIEAGRFVFFYQVLSNATREGARYAIIHGSNSSDPTGPGSADPTGADVKDAVRRAAFSIVSAGALAIDDPVYEPLNNDRGTNVTVTLDFTYPPILPVLPPITISAESTLVINN